MAGVGEPGADGVGAEAGVAVGSFFSVSGAVAVVVCAVGT